MSFSYRRAAANGLGSILSLTVSGWPQPQSWEGARPGKPEAYRHVLGQSRKPAAAIASAHVDGPTKARIWATFVTAFS